MSVTIPPSKPKASLGVVVAAANTAWDDAHPGTPLPEFFVLAVRAYYSNTFPPAGNNYGIFDDAFFVVTPFGFSAWNGNTDSSRIGWNGNAGKYMARLKPGVYDFRRLKHRMSSPMGYMAFGQGPNPVTVERIDRNGIIRQVETGEFGINLHRAGVNGTSSEGCLTVPVEQWISFRSTLDKAIAESELSTFPLILIEGPIV